MKKLSVIALFLMVAFLGCRKDNEDFGDGTSFLKFNLTDAPGPYDEVNVDVIGLQVILNDSIVDLDVNAGIYNLLDFVNGKDTLLVEGSVPSGKLSQVRLILGPENSIVIGDKTYELKTPSAQQSGLKLNVHADFLQGVAYEYTIDFDAARSVVETGNGKYILKPVLRVFTKSVTGAIKGVVAPASSKPLIHAISEAKDTTSVLADPLTGRFMFNGLPQGTYKVSFLPQDPFRDTLLTGIQVKTGIVTSLDTLKFK
ncbi:MAG: DUF4382 domain-containing protein [Chloroflexota bacterium]